MARSEKYLTGVFFSHSGKQGEPETSQFAMKTVCGDVTTCDYCV